MHVQKQGLPSGSCHPPPPPKKKKKKKITSEQVDVLTINLKHHPKIKGILAASPKATPPRNKGLIRPD